MDSKLNSLGFDSNLWSCTKVLDQPIIPHCHCAPNCNGYLVEQKEPGYWYIALLYYPRGDKVSMLTHTYPHKTLRKIEWPSAVCRLTTHLTSGLMSDPVICELRMSMAIHDTECT